MSTLESVPSIQTWLPVALPGLAESAMPLPSAADAVSPEAPTANATQGPWRDSLRCPKCHQPVRPASETYLCQNPSCGQHYPISRGGPVLINEDKSVFTLAEFLDNQQNVFSETSSWRSRISGLLPDLDLNPVGDAYMQRFKQELLSRFDHARILVVGGSIEGAGLACLANDPRIELVETDVTLSDKTQVICDAHDLPFADAAFHGVIVQAVLEHVLDPWRVVSELHRVLCSDGIVLADTPFIAQVHCRQYDFHRFTRLGHRRLFRHFQELDSGISGGPAVATLWTLRYFALSFCRRNWTRAAASLTLRCLLFPIKYLDLWLIHHAPANDAAMAFYFIGSKSRSPLSDQALLSQYQGGF